MRLLGVLDDCDCVVPGLEHEGKRHELMLCPRDQEHDWLERPAEDLLLEGVLAVGGADAALAQMVARLGPFGTGNAEPLFVLPRARIVKSERIGKDGGTIRALLEGEGGGRLKALLFRAKDGALAEAMSRVGAAPLHLAGYLRAESWQGRVSAGFFISDAALA